MGWKFKDGIPIWQQIVLQLQTRIAAGTWSAGERIPTVRELALEAGVNPNTMQRALSEMEREGLLYSERTSGRYVTEDEKILGRQKQQLSEVWIEELFEQMSQLGQSPAQVAVAVAEAARKKQEESNRKGD